jgi:hypothetical protein
MRRASPLVVLLLIAAANPGSASVRKAAIHSVQSPQDFDIQRRVDVNSLNMWTTNEGSIAWDISTVSSGLEFPRGSGKTAVFAGGLWLGARVNGEVRATVAEYSWEYGPGAMAGGTFLPDVPQFRVYKVVPWTGNPDDTTHVDRLAPGPREDPLAHHAWSEYMAGAAPYGAPVRIWQLPDPNDPNATVPVLGPDVQGDQMLWAVFNDADPSKHTNGAGTSSPLGVEVQQTMWGVNQLNPLANVVIIKYRLINKGSNQLDDMFVSLWADPDVGDPNDDLVGSDPALGLGYAYNATNTDLIYGLAPPAVGIMLLEGPKDAFDDTIPATSVVKYINGTDPQSVQWTYNYMQGLNADGSPQIDPNTNAVKTFVCDGDPVQGTGWLDSNPSDCRMMLSAGTFSMAPGDTQEVVFAILAGQSLDRLSSIVALETAANYLKYGVVPPPPPSAVNCPRPAAYWANECPPGSSELTPAQLASIAARVNTQSLFFDWTPGSETGAFCSTITPLGPLDARSIAKTEFATVLANWAAGDLGIVPSSGQPIRLLGSMPVGCPGVSASQLFQLVATAGPDPSLEVNYLNDNPAHRRALTGVNWGGASFFGGADFGWNFWGGSLDPAAHPDSFATVEVRFSHTATQKAYRYLRLQDNVDGSAPNGNREYRYGGFHEVPFQVWDTEHNVQLDVAWVERTVTDLNGTILPSAFQLATFDSTWAPDASIEGGREYLYILKTPYSSTPKAPFQVDEAMDVVPMPILYGLWSMLRAPSDIIDDGDRMEFKFAPFSGPGIDTRLLVLEGTPLSDPAVTMEYNQIIDCLRGINLGLTIENPCDQPTAVQLSLLSSDVNSDRVELAWYTPQASLPVTIERRHGDGDWTAVSQTFADAGGMIRYTDTDIVAGGRYGYRVAVMDGGVLVYAGETNVLVPARFQLSLAGFVPNPVRGEASIEFVLASREPATLEVFDLQGRRLVSREVGSLGPGRAVVSLGDAGALRSGVYMVMLRQGRASVSRKAVIVR